MTGPPVDVSDIVDESPLADKVDGRLREGQVGGPSVGGHAVHGRADRGTHEAVGAGPPVVHVFMHRRGNKIRSRPEDLWYPNLGWESGVVSVSPSSTYRFGSETLWTDTGPTEASGSVQSGESRN